MTLTNSAPPPPKPTQPLPTRSSAKDTKPSRKKKSGWFHAMLRRLHFYAGVFVGPFIFVAALTGALYAATPQLEKIVYHDQLYTASVGETMSLDTQVARAVRYVNEKDGGADAATKVTAVRPAPEPGQTSRIHFAQPNPETRSDSRAIFVDPVTGDIKGDLDVYGTTGAMPLRTWIDKFHRGLLLGDPGRIYSEFAASWMWVIAVGGVILWLPMLTSRLKFGDSWIKALRKSTVPDGKTKGRPRIMVLHAGLGLVLLVFMVFLSATGITWSQYAGNNVANLRSALSWQTPKPHKSLDGSADSSGGAHAEHGGSSSGHTDHQGALRPVDLGFDSVLRTARGAGIDSNHVEIMTSPAKNTAWSVRETDPHFPTNVDTVTVNPETQDVVDSIDFQRDFPLPAKLARWGIDIHMGTWLGLTNQIVLFLVALGMALMVVWGYAMWFARRPSFRKPKAPRRALVKAPWWGWVLVGAVAVGLGLFLPLFGIPLAIFVLVDAIAWALSKRGHNRERRQTRVRTP